jgi:hypothetical protein
VAQLGALRLDAGLAEVAAARLEVRHVERVVERQQELGGGRQVGGGVLDERRAVPGLGDGLVVGGRPPILGAISAAGIAIAGTGRPPFVADADPTTRSNPLVADTDGDGLLDGIEDADGDGALGERETDPSDADTDGDGLSDGREALETFTNPRLADTDEGSVDDGDELAQGTDPLNPADDTRGRDSDGDGLLDDLERLLGTDPNAADTDADGIEDGAEIAAGDPLRYEPELEPNPLDADTDDDGLLDGVERRGTGVLSDFGPTSPLLADTDADGLPDQDKAGDFNERCDEKKHQGKAHGLLQTPL